LTFFVNYLIQIGATVSLIIMVECNYHQSLL